MNIRKLATYTLIASMSVLALTGCKKDVEPSETAMESTVVTTVTETTETTPETSAFVTYTAADGLHEDEDVGKFSFKDKSIWSTWSLAQADATSTKSVESFIFSISATILF